MLAATQLPLLASLGLAKVQVIRKLKVTIFSTGSELQPIRLPLQPSQIYDNKRFAVHLLLSQVDCEVINLSIIRNTLAQ